MQGKCHIFELQIWGHSQLENLTTVTSLRPTLLQYGNKYHNKYDNKSGNLIFLKDKNICVFIFGLFRIQT